MDDEIGDGTGPLDREEGSRLAAATERAESEAEAVKSRISFEYFLSDEERDLYLRAVKSVEGQGTPLPTPGYLADASDLDPNKSIDQILDHLMATNPWVGSWDSEEDERSGAMYGRWVVRGEYFQQFQTDHIVTIPAWSQLTSVVTVGGVDLVVPMGITAAVGTQDGWWVVMAIDPEPSEMTKIMSVEIIRADLGDVSDLPRFPLHRWMLEALVKSNEQHIAGATAPDYRHKSRTRRRSDSPESLDLARVVRLRETQGMSFGLIGDAIGKSEPTARRWYKRAKETGL